MTKSQFVHSQAFMQSSCFNRCDTVGHNPDLPCQCNAKCIKYNDCCFDYSDTCLTCRGRCDLSYDDDLPCQCNSACYKHDDCCDDSCKRTGNTIYTFTST